MGQCPPSSPVKFEKFQTAKSYGELGPVSSYQLERNVCGYRRVASFSELEQNNVLNRCEYFVEVVDPSTGLSTTVPAGALPNCGGVDQVALNAKPVKFACSNTLNTYPSNSVALIQ